MNFKDAHAKLQKVAAGRYNFLQYGLTTNREGEKEQSCYVYVDPGGKQGGVSGSGKTWEKSFLELDEKLNPENHKITEIESIEELP